MLTKAASASARWRARQRGEDVPIQPCRVSSYGVPSGTPEYRRLQRERTAEREGRTIRPYLTTEERSHAARLESAFESMALGILAEQRTELRAKVQNQRAVLDDQERARRNAAFRNRYWNNPEFERERTIDYKARNWDRKLLWDETRMERIRANDDGTATFAAIKRLKQTSTNCHYCHKIMSESEKQTDHVIPLCAGGLHGIGNIVIACASCNGRKARMRPEEWDRVAC